MNERKTDTGVAQPPHKPEPVHPPLAAKIVVSQDQPAECTIFPPEADDLERMTTWITAQEGSFVSLEEMR